MSCTRIVPALLVVLAAFTYPAFGQMVDPETRIKTDGYESLFYGSDGIPWYTLAKAESQGRTNEIEARIAQLPKEKSLLPACDIVRGRVKAMLIEKSSLAFDVAVTDYGYDGQTIVCVLKYMLGNKVVTQIMYAKNANGAMYLYYTWSDNRH